MPPSQRPPRHLSGRHLPIERIHGKAILYRSHRSDRVALHFSTGHPKNRFDDPDGRFGVCYCALTPEGAFAETFLRQRKGGFVDWRELGVRSLAQIQLRKPLHVVSFYGKGLSKLGATAAVTAGPIPIAQQWSRALHAHPDTADGILYRIRHDNDQFGIALFQRCEPALTWLHSVVWQHADLNTICERYEISL